MSKINVKFIKVKLLGGILIASCALIILMGRLYADSNTWVDGSFPVLSVGQLATPTPVSGCFPSMFTYYSYTKPDGSYDPVGRAIQTKVCVLQNGLGFYGASSNMTDDYNFVKPGTGIAFRVVKPRDAAAAVTPVPGQPVFFTKDSTNSGHGEVAPHFYDSLASAGSFGLYDVGAAKELAFQLNQSGELLKDAAGKTIYMHAYAFSPDGKWMVIEAANLGFIRVNTQTREMQLFSTSVLAYNLGFTPKVTLAISNDGNTVIKSGNNAGETVAYDLSGCQPGPFMINSDNSGAVVGCRSRVLTKSLQSQMPGFAYLIAMRFSADGKSLALFAGHTESSGIIEYYQSTYAVAGYQTPHVGYIALGDSFSSGEGAFNYELGTNSDDPKNKCHLSTVSYPYLAASYAGIPNFHSVACSGAKVGDYFNAQRNENKVPDSPLADWIPGYQAQGKYINGSDPDIITISMIGNDIDFAGKLTTCIGLADDCFHFKEDRQMIANEIYNKFDTLVNLYTQIRADSGNPNVKIYVLGYPQIVGNGTCALNVPLALEERVMAQGLTSYLDTVIHAAADKAGVQYIDTEHAFDGHRLCENGTKAVNGLMAGNDFGLIGSGSFHPNVLGHQLFAQTLLAQSQDLTSTMPAANASVTAPYVGSSAYNNFIGDAPSANVQGLLYTSPTTLVVRATLTGVDLVLKRALLAIEENQIPLLANTPAWVWFNSTPALAGTLTTDSQGRLNGQVTIPNGITPGYHTLHVIAKDIGGEDVDLYQTVYVAASASDANGDGVPDDQEQCVAVPLSQVDQDRDGIDDACDAEITDAPVDSMPPVVSGITDREPDYNGWYSHDVMISWQATDPDPSSGTPSQPEATAANIEGNHTYESEPSCDPAGNCTAGSIKLKLDKTSPTIHYALTPAPNDGGWNNSAVTVTFTCDDALSGIEGCSDPITVSTDGATVITGTAEDNAGNTQSVNVIVSIDQTAPSVSADLSSQPNANGWNNTDVTIDVSCSDALSGIASCSSPQTVSSEGADQVTTSSALDKAGNISTVLASVNIDKTAPTIQSMTWSANPKAFTGPSTLTVRADDSLSGVIRAEYFIGDTDPGAGDATQFMADDGNFVATFGTDLATGVYKVTVRVQDKAGNWSAPNEDYLVVYNPFAIRMNGKRTIMPSLSHGDRLPGLASATQIDLAKFGFSVGYDKLGRVLDSDFRFNYTTGEKCNKPSLAAHCYDTKLDATSVDWFTTAGTNNSTGIFQGNANLVIDGREQAVAYRVVAVDGERLSPDGQDHLQLQIFTLGANPNTAVPLYQVNADVLRGNIHIKT